MDAQERVTSASERETLREEIKRIQLALEGNYDDGSGDENDSGGSEDEDALNIDEECEENLAEEDHLVQVYEETTDLDRGIEQFEDGEIVLVGDRGISEFLVGESTGYVASLSLNRAYQGVIKDCLKRIEDLLTSNSERQDELLHELEDRVLIRPNSVVSRKNQLSNYCVPYFKDADGMHPPANEDVRLKCARAEVRAQEMRPSIWKSSHKESLKKAVLNDAREKLLRPYMNRKEIKVEKLHAAQKVTEECKFRLASLEEEDVDEDEDDSSDEEWEEEEDEDQMPEKQKLQKITKKEKLGKERETELKEARKFEKEVRKKIRDIDREVEEKKSLSETALLKEMDPQKIDWLKISAFEFDGRWDSVACQQMWTNVVSPAINRSKWSKEENDQLLKLVKKYEKRNWPKIAQELGTNRTPFQCIQHYELKLNTSSHMSKGLSMWLQREQQTIFCALVTWTPEEEALLLEVVATCRMGNNIPWTQVSFYMEDKSATACQARYIQMDKTNKRGRWSAEEDALLFTQIHKYGPQQWTLIANTVPNRTAAQCRERWNKALNPTIRLGQWTYDEDKMLLMLMKEENNSCARVAHRMTGRTNSQVRKRYNVLKCWEKEMIWMDQQSKETREFLLGRPPNIVYRSLQSMLANVRKSAEAVTPDGTVNSSGKEKQKGEVGKDPAGSIYKPNKMEQRDLAVLVQCSSLFYDYLRQERDRQAGELVVPRPLVSKHSTRRCIQRLKMKERLRQAVLHQAGNTSVELDEGKEREDQGGAFVKAAKCPEQPCAKTGLLKTLHPNMTVREILEVTHSIAKDRKQNQDPLLDNPTLQDTDDNSRPVKKKGRKTLSRAETSLDQALRQTLVCQASAFTPIKKHGRRRRYFRAEDSSVHLDAEKHRRCEARTTSILMKAFKVDVQGAWSRLQGEALKSESDEVVPVTKLESIQRCKESLSQMRDFGFLTTQTPTSNGESQEAGTSRSSVAPPGDRGSGYKAETYRELPPLPPTWTTLAGFRGLKLRMGELVRKAASCSKSQMYSLKRKRAGKGDNSKDTEHHDELVLVKNKDLQDDPLSKIRRTEEFQLIQSRFNALFLWPTFLSSIPLPEKQTASQLVEEQQEDKGTQKTRKVRRRFNHRPRKKTGKKTVASPVNGNETTRSGKAASATLSQDTGTCSRETIKTDSVPKRRRCRRCVKGEQQTETRRTSSRLASKCKISETSETLTSGGLKSGAKGIKSSNICSSAKEVSEDRADRNEAIQNRTLSNEILDSRPTADESVKNKTPGDESGNKGMLNSKVSNSGTAVDETLHGTVGNESSNNGGISHSGVVDGERLNSKPFGAETSSAADLARSSKRGIVGDGISVSGSREEEMSNRQISNNSTSDSLILNSGSPDTMKSESQPSGSKKRKCGRPNRKIKRP